MTLNIPVAPETKSGADYSALSDSLDEFMTTFASFREENDERLRQIETRKVADVLTTEKVDRISDALDRQKRVLDELALKSRRDPRLAVQKPSLWRHWSASRHSRTTSARVKSAHCVRWRPRTCPTAPAPMVDIWFRRMSRRRLGDACRCCRQSVRLRPFARCRVQCDPAFRAKSA